MSAIPVLTNEILLSFTLHRPNIHVTDNKGFGQNRPTSRLYDYLIHDQQQRSIGSPRWYEYFSNERIGSYDPLGIHGHIIKGIDVPDDILEGQIKNNDE